MRGHYMQFTSSKPIYVIGVDSRNYSCTCFLRCVWAFPTHLMTFHLSTLYIISTSIVSSFMVFNGTTFQWPLSHRLTWFHLRKLLLNPLGVITFKSRSRYESTLSRAREYPGNIRDPMMKWKLLMCPWIKLTVALCDGSYSYLPGPRWL